MFTCTDSMLLSFFNLHTCALIYDILWHGRCIDKEHIWPTVLTYVIFVVPKCSKIQIFRGLRPGPHCMGELTQRASLLPKPPIAGGKETWCTLRSRPFDQASLLRLRVYSITELSVVNRTCKYDYYTTNTQQCIFLLAIVLYFNPKTFTVDHLFQVRPIWA